MAKSNPQTGSSFWVAAGYESPTDLPDEVRRVGPGAEPEPVATAPGPAPEKPAPEPTPEPEPDLDAAPEPEALPRPADWATKAEWVAYAVASGAAEADAIAVTKAELIDRFG